MTTPRPGGHRDRQFGLSIGAVLIVAAIYFWWRDRAAAAQVAGALGLVLLLLGRFRPGLLRYPSAVWWKLAAVLAFVNSRIILTLIFIAVLVPLGLVWRLIGRDPLARRRASWPGWSPYPARYRDPDHYTRMY
jgi:hypothetical protein